LVGETGTGKELAAQSIHEASARRDAPFVVVDCSTLTAQLIESELFGHERGAFTGAHERRVGAFEAANGGTVFLDEIGEMPLELQPKLLRVLEARAVRRLGGSDTVPVDVRVIAATHRDLRREVNEARFRADLYFRLAVAQVRLPPLRERPTDIPMLVRTLLERLGAPSHVADELLRPESLSRLQHAAWPGNVRELKNAIERHLVLDEPLPADDPSAPEADLGTFDPNVPFAAARRRLLEKFERRYLRALLEHHGGNVPKAARAAGIDRTHVYRLLRKQGAS
jgi:DNA-binding NtrC family response regulator